MLVTVSREDAARLLVEAVRYAVGRPGFVVEAVCDAAEQLLRALTIAEADQIAAAIDAGDTADARGSQADQDHWRRLRRQLHERTLVGAPEQVPLIGRDLALLCACAEQQTETLAAAEQEDVRARIARCRESLPPEEQTAFADDDVADATSRRPARLKTTTP